MMPQTVLVFWVLVYWRVGEVSRPTGMRLLARHSRVATVRHHAAIEEG
jgi:hypothetical protein